jgi:DNA-binding NarL/FixJ family response regulator
MAPGKRIRVVIVDDSNVMRDCVCSLLRDSPRVDIVGTGRNGREAIELVREHQPDLVLMDVLLPILNGLEAASRIRQEFPAVRIVHLGVEEAVQQASQRSGASFFVLKSTLASRYCDILEQLFGLSEHGSN